MSTSLIIIIVLAALALIAAMFVVGLYNKLVALRNRFKKPLVAPERRRGGWQRRGVPGNFVHPVRPCAMGIQPQCPTGGIPEVQEKRRHAEGIRRLGSTTEHMKTKIALAMLTIVGMTALPVLAVDSPELLKSYEAVSTALANDDLASAKTAATDLAEKAKSAGQQAIAEHAQTLSKSTSLEDAREHFKAISADAVKLAEKTEGYHVVQCPMADAKWVQSDEKVMNPYMGKKMQQCGKMMEMMKGMHGMMDDEKGADAGCMKCCPMMG